MNNVLKLRPQEKREEKNIRGVAQMYEEKFLCLKRKSRLKGPVCTVQLNV